MYPINNTSIHVCNVLKIDLIIKNTAAQRVNYKHKLISATYQFLQIDYKPESARIQNNHSN